MQLVSDETYRLMTVDDPLPLGASLDLRCGLGCTSPYVQGVSRSMRRTPLEARFLHGTHRHIGPDHSTVRARPRPMGLFRETPVLVAGTAHPVGLNRRDSPLTTRL